MRKGQSSIEFVTLFTLVMLLFLGGLYFTGQKLVQIEDERTQKNSNAISNILQSEIELASKSEGNYSRLFSLPTLFKKDNYLIDVYDNFELTIDYNNREYVYPLKRNIIFFNVHPGGDNIVSHINNTVFIGDDSVITVDPNNIVLGVPEGSTITMKVTVASIFGGLSAIMRILEEPDCNSGPPGNECSNLPEYIVLEQIDFINFTTDLQIKDFGTYKFTINGTTIFTPPGRLISPIQDHNEPFYWLTLLNMPPTYGDYILPDDTSVYEQPKNFEPRFYATFHDDNADLEDVYLEFVDSPIGPYTVDPVPDLANWENVFPPVNYDFTFDQHVPLPDFGFYTFTFNVTDSQGMVNKTPLRIVELRNINPVVDGVYLEGEVPLPSITSWSDVLNFNNYHVEVVSSDINWNVKNITLVFTDFLNLDRPTNLQNIVVNNPAFETPDGESLPDGMHNPNGGVFRAEFDESNGLIFDAYGQFLFKFVATDILGLTHESEIYQVNTYPPPHYDESSIMPADSTIFELYEGFETDFEITFYDDVVGGYDFGLLNYVELEFTTVPDYSVINGTEVTFDPVSEYDFSVPKSLDKFGEYIYRFTGMNYLGGSNTTELVHAYLVNVPPIIQGVYERVSYTDPPLTYFPDPYPARIPYDPTYVIGADGGEDIFYLYVTDDNRNLRYAKLIQDSSPTGAPGGTVEFSVPQDSGVYWPDFRDFLFTKFGTYSFHFEVEDEYDLIDTSQQFSLNLINEYPYFDDTYCPNGICNSDGSDLSSSTSIIPVLSSTQNFNFGVKVYASDINWNLDNAIVEFTEGPSHGDMYHPFPDNKGEGYCSGGDNVFSLMFDSTGVGDDTDYGTYKFRVMLNDDEGLNTYSSEYTLTLNNNAPVFTEVCPDVPNWLSSCSGTVYTPSPALFIFENVGYDGSTFNIPITLTASDVNHNLHLLKVKITGPSDSNLNNQVYNYEVSPQNTLSNTFSFDFDVIGDYNVEFWAYDQEVDSVYHNFEIKLQNPPPVFVDGAFSPGDETNIYWGDTIPFTAQATDAASDLQSIELIFTNGPSGSGYASLGVTESSGFTNYLYFSESVNFADFVFGTYTYHFKAVDSIGQLTNSPDRTLTVTNQDPSITGVNFDPAPAEFNEALFPSTNVDVTISDLSRNIVEVWISEDASGNHSTGLPAAHTVSNSFTVYDIPVSFSNAGFGNYDLYVNVKDSEDRTVQAGPYTFDFANSAPVISGSPTQTGTLTKSIAENNGYDFVATFIDANSNIDRIVRSAISGTGVSACNSNNDCATETGDSSTLTSTQHIMQSFGSFCTDNCKTYSYTAYDSEGSSGSSGTKSFNYVDDYPTISVSCPFSTNDDVSTPTHICTVSKTDSYNSVGGGGSFTGDACSLVSFSSPGSAEFFSESSDCTFNFNFLFGCTGHSFTFRVTDNEGRFVESSAYNINYVTNEICDNIDNNCYGGVDEGCDDDNDGYCDSSMTVVGTPNTCTAGGSSSLDCDDSRSDVHPGAEEVCDGYDNDCNAGNGYDYEGSVGCNWYNYDGDNDGYGSATVAAKCYCSQTGYYDVTNTDDCCDSSWSTKPGQTNYYPFANSCGSFDYDCSDSIEYEHGLSEEGNCRSHNHGWEFHCHGTYDVWYSGSGDRYDECGLTDPGDGSYFGLKHLCNGNCVTHLYYGMTIKCR